MKLVLNNEVRRIKRSTVFKRATAPRLCGTEETKPALMSIHVSKEGTGFPYPG